jgi:hypothetical protein
MLNIYKLIMLNRYKLIMLNRYKLLIFNRILLPDQHRRCRIAYGPGISGYSAPNNDASVAAAGAMAPQAEARHRRRLRSGLFGFRDDAVAHRVRPFADGCGFRAREKEAEGRLLSAHLRPRLLGHQVMR